MGQSSWQLLRAPRPERLQFKLLARISGFQPAQVVELMKASKF